MRRIPLIPTLLVLVAAGIMVSLGVWQLHRADWKENLLARYKQAGSMGPVAFPSGKDDAEAALYRRSSFLCDRVISHEAVAGRNRQDVVGWAQVARCAVDGGGEADVVMGWSVQPNAETLWNGGMVEGIVGPGRNGEVRLVADPPLAGLEANAAPDPANIPNNHLSYAGQWFFFALTALVIYGIALRARLRGKGSRPGNMD